MIRRVWAICELVTLPKRVFSPRQPRAADDGLLCCHGYSIGGPEFPQ
jgi:hypothetical protein